MESRHKASVSLRVCVCVWPCVLVRHEQMEQGVFNMHTMRYRPQWHRKAKSLLFKDVPFKQRTGIFVQCDCNGSGEQSLTFSRTLEERQSQTCRHQAPWVSAAAIKSCFLDYDEGLSDRVEADGLDLSARHQGCTSANPAIQHVTSATAPPTVESDKLLGRTLIEIVTC